MGRVRVAYESTAHLRSHPQSIPSILAKMRDDIHCDGLKDASWSKTSHVLDTLNLLNEYLLDKIHQRGVVFKRSCPEHLAAIMSDISTGVYGLAKGSYQKLLGVEAFCSSVSPVKIEIIIVPPIEGTFVRFCSIGGLTTGLPYSISLAINHRSADCWYANAKIRVAYGSSGALVLKSSRAWSSVSALSYVQ